MSASLDAQPDSSDDRLQWVSDLIPTLTMGEKLDLIDRLTRSIEPVEAPRPPATDEQKARRQHQAVLTLIDDLAKMRTDSEPIFMNDRDHDRIIYGI